MSEGLSQDDFRRLMATPRHPSSGEGGSQQSQFKAPAPRAPKNSGAVFGQPRSMRKKNFKKPFKKDNEDGEEDEESGQSKSNYRDRAAERRQQELGNTELTDEQMSAEELLQRTTAEAGDELDPKQVYEQSKFLGGDVDHTHLVKGLDFALLRKVRNDLSKSKQQQQQQHQQNHSDDDDDNVEQKQQQDTDMDDDLDQVLEKFERGEKIADDSDSVLPAVDQDKPKFHSLMAKNIFEFVDQSEEPPRVELFEPGRMAYVFELADEVGHYSDAFAIPTAMIRSKADVAAKLAKTGWSEETQAETSLVLEKITQVMNRVRGGINGTAEDKSDPFKKSKKVTTSVTSQPVAMVDDMFMGDIFADAGRDYELDEKTVAKTTANDEPAKKGSYFKDLIDEEEEDTVMTEASNDAVNALLSKATGSSDIAKPTEDGEKEAATKKRKYENVEMDADAADIDMFGLSSAALPVSFEEHQHIHAYQSDDEANSPTKMMDQGTNRNKKAQLTRWDFDTEDEWQKYKDTIEIHPKSAVQFGVKLGDGRKRNRERKGMNDKQRLDRDYQQVKNIMTKKYGKSLDE